MISLIIINHNGKELTAQCLRSLERLNLHESYEVIVVDNASEDKSVDFLQKEFPDVVILPQSVNKGFGTANNIGVQKAQGEYLFFVNNDVLFQMDVISPLKNYLQSHEHAGAVAPMLLNSDGTYQHSYGKYPSLLNELRTKRDTVRLTSPPADHSPRRVEWVSFAAVMIRRTAFEKIHGFDERYFMYFEDADVCYRLKKAGFDTFYCAESICVHLGGKSWSPRNTALLKKEYRRSQMLYYSLHRSWLSSFSLRLYLIARFGILSVIGNKESRLQARSVFLTAILSYANRS